MPCVGAHATAGERCSCCTTSPWPAPPAIVSCSCAPAARSPKAARPKCCARTYSVAPTGPRSTSWRIRPRASRSSRLASPADALLQVERDAALEELIECAAGQAPAHHELRAGLFGQKADPGREPPEIVRRVPGRATAERDRLADEPFEPARPAVLHVLRVRKVGLVVESEMPAGVAAPRDRRGGHEREGRHGRSRDVLHDRRVREAAASDENAKVLRELPHQPVRSGEPVILGLATEVVLASDRVRIGEGAVPSFTSPFGLPASPARE